MEAKVLRAIDFPVGPVSFTSGQVGNQLKIEGGDQVIIGEVVAWGLPITALNFLSYKLQCSFIDLSSSGYAPDILRRKPEDPDEL